MDEERKIGQTLSTTFLRSQPRDLLDLSGELWEGLQKKDPKNKGFGKTTQEFARNPGCYHPGHAVFQLFLAILVSK